MRIAIDGRTIVRKRTGVGVYAERFVRSLLRIDQKNSYTLFMAEDDPSLEAPNLTKVLLPASTTMGPNRWWENFTLPRFLRRHSIDIYFSPAYVLPLLHRSRSSKSSNTRTLMVATIHDLVSYHFPETFTLKMRIWQRLFVGNAVRVADCIFADSLATKLDIHNFYDVPQEVVKVVYLPVDAQFQPVKERETLDVIRARYKLPPKFILYLGTLEPRKNVGRLAAAYARLPDLLREQHSLVLAGGLGWYSGSIRQEIDELHLGEQIKLLGYVNLSDLPGLYTLASAFVYLSLYEGFGAPPLEAMACGTPVIASRSSSLPEVVGDAGILVDPLDLEEITAQLTRVLTDEPLRSQLGAAGLKQAGLFAANDKAEELLQIFEKLVEQRRSTAG
ncbi:MAG TPA: hypothetical protein DEP53_06380 [Bacteroidetes bacterium]|nr:hypothetical protein [Bacteroidota bacterium]